MITLNGFHCKQTFRWSCFKSINTDLPTHTHTHSKLSYYFSWWWIMWINCTTMYIWTFFSLLFFIQHILTHTHTHAHTHSLSSFSIYPQMVQWWTAGTPQANNAPQKWAKEDITTDEKVQKRTKRVKKHVFRSKI